jgi:hypothetical protein
MTEAVRSISCLNNKSGQTPIGYPSARFRAFKKQGPSEVAISTPRRIVVTSRHLQTFEIQICF